LGNPAFFPEKLGGQTKIAVFVAVYTLVSFADAAS